jgi:trehalose/maltose transport system substrate-binding protein
MRNFGVILLALASFSLSACHPHASAAAKISGSNPKTLTLMSIVDGPDADFELEMLNEFAKHRGNLQIRYIPAFESSDERLAMYKQLFKERSPQPDLCEVDVIWPGMIADDLVDLGPYFGDELRSFPADLLASYTVRGRLIAIPLFSDGGLLYYRSDLLHKYGFKGPPKTWDELEKMAEIIQRGERRHNDSRFWGYVWQGGASEALTCNALEWQASQGGGHIIEPDGRVSVCNANAIRAVERAVSWIGKISPPGVTAYVEDDGMNLYKAGHAAFMRSWSSAYGSFRDPACAACDHTAAALLPAGASGRSRTLGGIAVSVSKYSEHRNEAIATLQQLVSEASQIRRALQTGSPPTRLALQQRADLMKQTAFHGTLQSSDILAGLVARPSIVAGTHYDEVSKAYFSAVHSALTRQVPVATALANLQAELIKITEKR